MEATVKIIEGVYRMEDLLHPEDLVLRTETLNGEHSYSVVQQGYGIIVIEDTLRQVPIAPIGTYDSGNLIIGHDLRDTFYLVVARDRDVVRVDAASLCLTVTGTADAPQVLVSRGDAALSR